MDVTAIDRMEIAKRLLKSADKLQLLGLKAVLKETIEDPLVPPAAREHAQRAFETTSDIESEREYAQTRLQEWMRLMKVSLIGNTFINSDGDTVEPPNWLSSLLSESALPNLRRRVVRDLAEIGEIAKNTVYNDMIVTQAAKKSVFEFRLPEEGERDEDKE